MYPTCSLLVLFFDHCADLPLANNTPQSVEFNFKYVAFDEVLIFNVYGDAEGLD